MGRSCATNVCSPRVYTPLVQHARTTPTVTGASTGPSVDSRAASTFLPPPTTQTNPLPRYQHESADRAIRQVPVFVQSSVNLFLSPNTRMSAASLDTSMNPKHGRFDGFQHWSRSSDNFPPSPPTQMSSLPHTLSHARSPVTDDRSPADVHAAVARSDARCINDFRSKVSYDRQPFSFT